MRWGQRAKVVFFLNVVAVLALFLYKAACGVSQRPVLR